MIASVLRTIAHRVEVESEGEVVRVETLASILTEVAQQIEHGCHHEPSVWLRGNPGPHARQFCEVCGFDLGPFPGSHG